MDWRSRITDSFLLILIVANIVDFAGLLPGDLDLLKKFISWLLVGLLFYRVHFTWLFLGNKRSSKQHLISNHAVDIGILASYFLFSIKDLIAVSDVLLEEVSPVFFNFLLWFLQNAVDLQVWSTYLGMGLLTILSFILCFHSIQRKSFLGNAHLDSVPVAFRFPAIFFVLFAFYVLVFDLLLQWLGIATDSLVIVLGLTVYIFWIVRRHHHYSPHTFIHRVGSFGEKFEERFLGFFHTKEKMFLGVMGLFVLHLLTELANFVLPYLLLNNSIYFSKLQLTNLFTLFMQDMSHNPIAIIIYILNIIAFFILALLPVFIWIELYNKQSRTLPRWLIGLSFSALPTAVFLPLFKLTTLNTGQLIGVHILTQSIIQPNLAIILSESVALGIIAFALSFTWAEKSEYHVIVIATLAFLIYYMSLFYISVTTYTTNTISFLKGDNLIILLLFLLFVFIIKIIFFIGVTILFITQVIKHHLW